MRSFSKHLKSEWTLYLIETPFNTFANRADPDHAALVRAAWPGSTLFALIWNKDKDKEALFNVAYNVTDNISSWAILRHKITTKK